MSEEHVDLHEGSRVTLLVPGSAAYVDLVISLLAAGMFPVPLDPALTPAERERVLADVSPDLVVDSPDLLASMVEHAPARYRLGIPRGHPIHVTSGTTGTSKGVFSGLLTPEDAEALVAEERDLWGFRDADIHLVVSPLHHSAPLRFAIGTLLAGGRLVVPGAFDPARLTAAIEAERPSTMFCVPTHLQRLFTHWDDVGVPDLSCFRLVAHAGAPCPPTVKERLIALFPAGSTWEFYGATEGQLTACRSEEWQQHRGTVGRARPGRRLEIDADGTIWCTVPAYARFSYLGAPEKTAAAWRGNAFTVGDLGRLDDDGYLYLEGRREDLVISGGVNVYPAEVEAVLGDHPGVTDVAVFGRPDEAWGQRVCAAVVGTASAADLAAYAREHLAPAKRPKEWLLLEAVPRTASGKVLRRDLAGG